MLGQLRLHLEHYYSKRSVEHPWLGAMTALYQGCEVNMIKLHSLIGRYKQQLAEDDPKRLRFNRRLKWGQIFASRHMRRVLVWPHDELCRILEEATGESKKFYPYRYVDDLEIPALPFSFTGPRDLTTVPPTDWPFPEEKTGLVAPPIPSNDQLRAHRTRAAIYHSWVGNHPDELEANIKSPPKSSLGQKIRAFLAKLKEKRGQSKAAKDAQKNDKKTESTKADTTGDAANGTSAISLSIPTIAVDNADANRAETSSIIDDINAIGTDGIRVNGLTQHPVRQPVDE